MKSLKYPVVADIEVIVGSAGLPNEKFHSVVSEPRGVTTCTGPEVNVGVVTVICVSETTFKDVPGVPLKFTAVAPVNPIPYIVTEAPFCCCNELMDVITVFGGNPRIDRQY